jgi:hypothetical protein
MQNTALEYSAYSAYICTPHFADDPVDNAVLLNIICNT